MTKYKGRMRGVVEAAKALSDPNRVRALLALRGRELCLCQLIELLRLAPSTVSKHMTVLKGAGLVEARKDGRWVHFRLARGEAAPAARRALAWARSSLSGDTTAKADDRRLRRILKADPQALCRRHLRRGS